MTTTNTSVTTGEDDNPCHATLYYSMNYSDVGSSWSVSRSWCWNTSPFFIDCAMLPSVQHYPTQDDEKMCCEVSIKYPFMSCSSLLCLLQMAKNCPYLLLTCFLVQCYCTRRGFSEFVSVARCLSPILQCMNRRRSQCEKHFCTLRRSCSATNAKTLMVLF